MSIELWIGFIGLILFMLALDLGVFNKQDHVINTREALGWTAVWVCISLLFNVFIYFLYAGSFGELSHSALSGKDAALEFLTGYVIEKSLSLDNIFVIALVFNYFKVPGLYQHRVLFWGVMGALVMRGAMIAAGTALIRSFSWTVYLFGGLLLLTAVRMMLAGEDAIEPEKNIFVRAIKRVLPFSPNLDGHNFTTRHLGRRVFTPLFLVLMVVEGTDVVFAVDSIPAIFAVTQDPFIVFTSNIFAILGLRSLYFALASLLDKFRYLKQSLVFVLAYVGVKMLASHSFHIPPWFSLILILTILTIGVLASVFAARWRKE